MNGVATVAVELYLSETHSVLGIYYLVLRIHCKLLKFSVFYVSTLDFCICIHCLFNADSPIGLYRESV